MILDQGGLIHDQQGIVQDQGGADRVQQVTDSCARALLRVCL
eukprot:CAMPEP_0172753406 /NCGR_PEP_ID=MMETSP1074-20121228/155875_1 /TAXON_ID=2916 /ORGANISM="Ceratium fusus, Strain PA161109" /LENGTH=41 /DNA_ID= /DNA_START= /DNA_END= /DNA_ORIENTATION=